MQVDEHETELADRRSACFTCVSSTEAEDGGTRPAGSADLLSTRPIVTAKASGPSQQWNPVHHQPSSHQAFSVAGLAVTGRVRAANAFALGCSWLGERLHACR